MNKNISTLLTTAIVTGMLAGQAANAETEEGNKSATGTEVSGAKEGCNAKNSGKGMKKKGTKKKGDKSACSGPNGCAAAKSKADTPETPKGE